MASEKKGDSLQTIHRMIELMDALLDNAQQLIELAQGAATAQEFEPAQDEQEKLILQINQLDAQLTDQTKGKAADKHPEELKELDEKMDLFSQFNQTFIDHLSVRRELIHFDIQENKKAIKSVADVRATYTKQASKGKKASRESRKQGSGRINTLS